MNVVSDNYVYQDPLATTPNRESAKDASDTFFASIRIAKDTYSVAI
jgi:hypothetical protein